MKTILALLLVSLFVSAQATSSALVVRSVGGLARPQDVRPPTGDWCEACVIFMNSQIQELIQIVANIGIEDGCASAFLFKNFRDLLLRRVVHCCRARLGYERLLSSFSLLVFFVCGLNEPTRRAVSIVVHRKATNLSCCRCALGGVVCSYLGSPLLAEVCTVLCEVEGIQAFINYVQEYARSSRFPKPFAFSRSKFVFSASLCDSVPRTSSVGL